MLEQYLHFKEENPGCLLFFRMGDFYELFFEDAETVAKAVQIALTSRNPNDENPIPMCGMPHHSVEPYLSQLLEKGYKIAICDQIEDPREAKGLVKRDVTRVLTPGTVVEDSNLKSKENNYLGSLYWDASTNTGGIAWLDFSTGQWSGLLSRKEPELWQWLVKINPSELLLPQGFKIPPQFTELSSQVTSVPLGAYFDISSAVTKIQELQGTVNMKALDLDDKPELVRACGALLTYLEHTQKSKLGHLGEFKPLNLGKHLLLDEITERNLEIFRRLDGKTGKGTLWKVLDKTKTSMGGRLLESRLRQPWRDRAPIEKSLECVTFLFERDHLRADLRNALDSVYDLERLSTRVFLGRATPKDFIALRQSLHMLPKLRDFLSTALQEDTGELTKILKKWDNMEDIASILDVSLVDSPPPNITDGGLFKKGFDAKLDELIELTEHGEDRLKRLHEKELNQNDIPKLKLGFNKIFGYYFEVSKAFKGQVPEHFIRRQTLVNSERYITPELKEMEDRIISASDDRKSLEYKLFIQLREQLSAARSRFLFMADVIASIDFWQGLAETARVNEWCRPSLHEGMEIEIEAGRHPVVEDAMGASNYIPGDLRIDHSRRILLITGPNMAGKSTVLRQVAILTIMAQIGSFVPAKKAQIGLADRVFSRVGASDNLAQGHSTFMVEMTETARILRQATKRSLVILDEIGRGTSTYDGLSLAWAVVEELSTRARGGIRTLFATHYHELTALEGKIDGLRNLNIAVKEWKGDIVFLRRLVPGPADRSYGIEVAKLAGVPKGVVDRAREILAELEEKSHDSRAKGAVERASQTLLPGFGAPPIEISEELTEHPIVTQLTDLDVDGMTPIQALMLLNQWKDMIKG
ncbi:DNA mismatch repair protein MutS [Pseudodesulfovibrio piezophilus]|uniref:DNA mismatch repair protein MutS n=1 Tax=Pseudodesulfovibrio piezophilus (strain DSM 21447 / JCM 15486 / C1TLV30) TaxID=1322246 RepID=M1WLI9_PSEP2|nr:DNA mismatch repair protein MutS [Pseudodesulfovibrio piezophilus]CCH47945.1 DNA mismatch repair protein mutS [Pseudodesulfovibrio piezophilus C1TLV30]